MWCQLFHPSMKFGSIPLFLSFFAVAMSVNHRKDKYNKSADQQHNEDGLIPPDFAEKL